MNVLVVENHGPTLVRLQQLLAGLPGTEVGVATSLAEVGVKLQAHWPQLVVFDLALCDGNGIGLLREIRQTLPQAMVIIATNHIFYKKRCLLEGADYFFDKSIELDLLMETITAHTRQQPCTAAD